MKAEMEEKVDWVNLPKNIKPISLRWTLHDSKIVSCVSNLLECYITLELALKSLSERITVFLKLKDVTSVRANILTHWVGLIDAPDDISNEEREHLQNIFWSKCREESLSWSEFEESLKTEPFDVRAGQLVLTENETALQIWGYLHGKKFCDVTCSLYFKGKTLTATRNDDEQFNLEDFINLDEKNFKELINGA